MRDYSGLLVEGEQTETGSRREAKNQQAQHREGNESLQQREAAP
jgi:hypothetical protein